MNTLRQTHVPGVQEIPMQEASLDIWDKKYRLKAKDGSILDTTVDDTWKRVARALADIEENDCEVWYERFLWALRHGAIPAGRIVSNAGARAYKPATSTINCTVSGSIGDSMDDILSKVHEAGLTLKSGAGIGYEFSTLRPRGAYVSGAGAYTSGPLSFMDIFDKMCFTVSSAGGRRGAQMGTFDVGHPDVVEFVRAKREQGRLRQFNLSLLVTSDFMRAVESDGEWPLAFPLSRREQGSEFGLTAPSKDVIWREWPLHDQDYVVNDEGLVACKVYRYIRARRLWDLIMSSTYDYAEPGFVLIDRVNELNNNWFCENIRATNPCVTADTRLATQHGLLTVGELYARRLPIQATVDKRALGSGAHGTEVRPAKPIFLTASKANVYRVITDNGYEIKATAWHDFYTARGKLKLSDLRSGDEILVQSGKGQFGELGSRGLGYQLGVLAGLDSKGSWKLQSKFHAPMLQPRQRVGVPRGAKCQVQRIEARSGYEAYQVALRAFWRLNTIAVDRKVPDVVWRGCESCVKGYLRGLLDTRGCLNVLPDNGSCSIFLHLGSKTLASDVQLLLSNFGIVATVCESGGSNSPLNECDEIDGGGSGSSPSSQSMTALRIAGKSLQVFMLEIGCDESMRTEYRQWRAHHGQEKDEPCTTKVVRIVFSGTEPVFDTTQDDQNTVIFNGLVTGQCGEQPLPPYGSCLLGSVNLTRFVSDPFTDQARFDWDSYREVVRLFTRMLDNVVEINGLPLQQQQNEILRKRRHGMGFLGLGSALAMLRLRYGSSESIEFTELIAREMALAGWREGLKLAQEKGPAPIMDEEFTIDSAMIRLRPELLSDGFKVGDTVKARILWARYSRYMQKIAKADPELVADLEKTGSRFTHHTSIAPTGTISLSLANNAANGIEPSFAHHYFRNVIREGRKTKEKMDVFSFELLAYRELVDKQAVPDSESSEHRLPDYFVTAEDITPKEHVDIQAAAQKWIDSSISKTANVPTNYPYEKFKDIYLYAWREGLKGCTTFRFNPEAFQGVLVKEQDLKNTHYRFTLEDGSVVEARGDDLIEYDGEVHTAANLFDALKEGYYGKW